MRFIYENDGYTCAIRRNPGKNMFRTGGHFELLEYLKYIGGHFEYFNVAALYIWI